MLAKGIKYILLIMMAALLSPSTVILGALPMRVLRRSYGRLPYWAGMLATAAVISAAGVPFWGLILLALTVATGVYAEIEEQGGSAFLSGFGGILTAVGVSVLSVGAWVYTTGSHLLAEVRAQVAPMVASLTQVNTGAPAITVDQVIQELPSGIVVALMVALAIALIGESKLRNALRLSSERPEGQPLKSFRVPDALVWAVILTVLGAFFKHGIGWLQISSQNVFQVLMAVYFFQGLAVVAHVFESFKVSPLWQGLWYLVLVLQLFLAVSLVGFADYWLEFRSRLTGKPATPDKNTNRSF